MTWPPTRSAELSVLGEAELRLHFDRVLLKRLRMRGERLTEIAFREVLARIAREYGLDASSRTTVDLSQAVFAAFMADFERSARENIERMGPEARARAIAEIDKALGTLSTHGEGGVPVNSQVDKLSAEALLKAFAAGGAAGAGFAALNAAGFGLYLAATTITKAIVTTLGGITLGFGVYTGLASTIAFLISPPVAAILTLSAGGVAMGLSGRHLPPRVAAMVVSQVFLRTIHVQYGAEQT